MASSLSPEVAVTRTINDFSTEILRLVLHEVKQKSLAAKDGTFLNALSVCKLWSHIGASLLYTDVRLSGKQLVQYVLQAHPSSELTRSLTIVLQYSDWSSFESVLNARGESTGYEYKWKI